MRFQSSFRPHSVSVSHTAVTALFLLRSITTERRTPGLANLSRHALELPWRLSWLYWLSVLADFVLIAVVKMTQHTAELLLAEISSSLVKHRFAHDTLESCPIHERATVALKNRRAASTIGAVSGDSGYYPDDKQSKNSNENRLQKRCRLLTPHAGFNARQYVMLCAS